MHPWQEEVSKIALQVDAKISELKDIQTTVVSFLEAPFIMDIFDTTREWVDQMDKDLAELKASFV